MFEFREPSGDADRLCLSSSDDDRMDVATGVAVVVVVDSAAVARALALAAMMLLIAQRVGGSGDGCSWLGPDVADAAGSLAGSYSPTSSEMLRSSSSSVDACGS